MKPDDLALVQSLPMFRRAQPEHLDELVRGGYLQRYPRGTLLFQEGAHADFLMILMEGAVEMFARDQDGNEAVVQILFPVDSFILAAALTDTPYLMSARTLQPSRILLLEAGAFRRIVSAHADLSVPVMAELAQQFRRLVRQIKDLKLRTGAQRLGCFLLALPTDGGPDGGTDGRSVTLPFDKRILASRLGMTAENLSRAFSTLRGHGLQVQGARIILEDVARLSAFCRPDPLIDGVEGELAIPTE